MANLKQDIEQALSWGRNRFPLPWNEFIKFAASDFFQIHLRNTLHKDSSSSPNLNGLIHSLRHRDGFSINRQLPTGASMRYDSRERDLQVIFWITGNQNGEVQLSLMGFSFDNAPMNHPSAVITLSGDESELVESIVGFLLNDLPAFLKEARLAYMENTARQRITDILASTMTGMLTQVLKESGFREDEYSIRVLMPKMFIKVLGRRHEIRITENSYREKLTVLERRIREFGESRG